MKRTLHDYRQMALASPDVRDLSGRRYPHMTAFVADAIVAAMPPSAGDTILDIGCGDGAVLQRMALMEPGADYYGVLPSAEEVARVTAHLAALPIKIMQGLAQDTRLPSHFADKIICNSVFLHLPRDQVEVALGEFARLAKPGAKIFLGEIPDCDEAQWVAQRGSSLTHPRRILKRLRDDGVSAFWYKIRDGIKRVIEHHVYESSQPFYATVEKFGAMANSAGMTLLWYRPFVSLDKHGRRVQSQTHRFAGLTGNERMANR